MDDNEPIRIRKPPCNCSILHKLSNTCIIIKQNKYKSMLLTN